MFGLSVGVVVIGTRQHCEVTNLHKLFFAIGNVYTVAGGCNLSVLYYKGLHSIGNIWEL